MGYIIEVKTSLKGRRKILFEKIVREREESTAAVLREIIDFYIKNHPEEV